ncbi:Aminodeoxychorismate synthase component 1 [Neorhodopirellula pilleata]|uniref:Aminodeoxychorismate synthase component 1 n=2 Tax=Neorhodopirellula pilleata TaxID=2714738 RepID=A0A5C6AQH4_9BACT|nr:Aminodeoxychorismate synthase component 1 [Neorhodopirellula pilleata]
MRLQTLPHCVWLDSASDHAFDRGRYSFLTADPVAFCNASLSSPDPWPVLKQWCRGLQNARASLSQVSGSVVSDYGNGGLPPFWGGVVGLLAYEASWWLEPSLRDESWLKTPLNQPSPVVVPGMAIGVYDWTIAIDHLQCNAWLISTGLNELFETDADRARRRADGVMDWIETASASTVPPISAIKTTKESLPSLSSNFTDESFSAGVAEIIARICRGDSFQVNLAQTLTHPAMCSAAELYRRLRTINPAPYAGFFDAGDYQIVSSSPEGFLQVRLGGNGISEVVTRPIKGTVRRCGDDAEDARLGETLLASEKDRAENVMIVDLMRNDLSRVCIDDSVQVTGLCELEMYQRVQHLVSTVYGRLRPDCDVSDLLAACFPGGSITGAPKVEAMRTIAELERRPRGAYCGSMGYVSLSGAADFNILIRTITHRPSGDPEAREAIWEFPVGGGITAKSDPKHETEETWIKAASLLEVIGSVG